MNIIRSEHLLKDRACFILQPGNLVMTVLAEMMFLAVPKEHRICISGLSCGSQLYKSSAMGRAQD